MIRVQEWLLPTSVEQLNEWIRKNWIDLKFFGPLSLLESVQRNMFHISYHEACKAHLVLCSYAARIFLDCIQTHFSFLAACTGDGAAYLFEQLSGERKAGGQRRTQPSAVYQGQQLLSISFCSALSSEHLAARESSKNTIQLPHQPASSRDFAGRNRWEAGQSLKTPRYPQGNSFTTNHVSGNNFCSTDWFNIEQTLQAFSIM